MSARAGIVGRVKTYSSPVPPSRFSTRRVLKPNEHGFGWSPGSGWWDFHTGHDPRPDGWGHYYTATIYQLRDGGFLAVSHGPRWENSERVWKPTYSVCADFESAMDFCEDDLISLGAIQP